MDAKTKVPTSKVNEWLEAYENGELPEGYSFTGGVKYGRPKLFEGDMETLSIRIPSSQKSALREEAAKRGASVSDYVRGILALRQA